MLDYDFLILQHNEFECLTRDLLQKKEHVFVESFTPGRDGGIDLRFAEISGETSIVQCKRFTDFSDLYGNLKKEVAKVKRLKPARYLLSTSVALTPKNKDMIMSLFEGYIKKTDDIWGRNDLNNLLGLYPDVEKQYYKLWLGSTSVLEGIVNKRIENWSGFEIEEIKRVVSTYVMNDSFNEALQILSDNRYVIISGIPGIGKTTLARILAYHILGKGYEEFIKVSTMDDAVQKLTEGKKQVFYFDDFLGANFFDVKEVGFEDKVVSFIQRIKRSSDKLFILSTREYILQTARRQYEKFELKNIEMAKCTIELSKYNEDIRAKILYNHLAESNLPRQYYEAILENKQYLKIIKHQNFNPRIIEAFLNKNLYTQTTPEQFVKNFLDFFDRPYSVWEYAFRKMPVLAQNALFVLLSMGGCSYLADWSTVLRVFAQGTQNDLHLFFTEEAWKEVLDYMQGTFIILNRSPEGTVAEFHNPSVFDFLIDYLHGLPQTQLSIIKYAVFSDQLWNLFTDKETAAGEYGKIRVPLEWDAEIVAAIKQGAKRMAVSKLERGNGYYIHKRMNMVRYLIGVQRSFPVIVRNNPGLIESEISEDLILDQKSDIDDRLDLLSMIDESKCGIDLKAIFPLLMEEIDWSYQLVNFLTLLDEKMLLSDLIDKDDSIFQLVKTVIDSEIDNLDSGGDGDILKDDIQSICWLIPTLDASYWFNMIDAKLTDDSPEEEEQEYDDDWARESFYRSPTPKDNTYEEMFSSLLI